MLSKVVRVEFIQEAWAVLGAACRLNSGRHRNYLLVSTIAWVGAGTSAGCLVDSTVGANGSGASTSSSLAEGSAAGATDSASAGTGATSGASGSQDGVESGVQGKACGDLKEAVCLQRVPVDWYGPIQPQRSTRLEDLTECEGPGVQFDSKPNFVAPVDEGRSALQRSLFPDASTNVFVDSMTGAPASCSSECTSELEIGTCAPMTFIMKKYDASSGKCGDMILDVLAPVITNTCEHLDPRWLPSNDMAIGAIPPQPMQGEALCKAAGAVNENIPAPKAGQYYRVCAGQEEYERECPAGKVCTRFPDRDNRNRVAMGCIYKKGDVACPAGDYNGSRVLLYGGANDDRGCTECQVDHKKGTLDCYYDIKVAANSPDANCDEGFSARAEDICLTQQDLAADSNGAAAVQGTYLEIRYNGTCSAKAAEPKGVLELKEPVTLCCAGF